MGYDLGIRARCQRLTLLSTYADAHNSKYIARARDLRGSRAVMCWCSEKGRCVYAQRRVSASASHTVCFALCAPASELRAVPCLDALLLQSEHAHTCREVPFSLSLILLRLDVMRFCNASPVLCYEIVSERIAPLLCSQACYCALRAPSQTAHIPSSYSLRLEDPLPDLPRDPVAISVRDASSERTPRVHRATAEVKPGTH